MHSRSFFSAVGDSRFRLSLEDGASGDACKRERQTPILVHGSRPSAG